MSDQYNRNLILSRLDEADRAALAAAGVVADFPVGQVFQEASASAAHVWFVLEGIISAVAVMEDGRTVETFMIGREGVANAWGADAVPRGFSRLVAQREGQALRIELTKLQALADQRPGIRRAVADYGARLQAELEQSIACNALHRAEQRFAKWLLRCHDRTQGDVLHLTQEYFAAMLGSQRTTVNEAAQALQRAGGIAYTRGRVAIQDRLCLERAACECYDPRTERKAVAV